MLLNQYRIFTTSLIIFFSIILLQTSLISIATQSLPNHVDFSIIESLGLFSNLLQANPEAAIRHILLETPVVIIQRINNPDSSQAWGMYLMPISLITQYIVSVFIALTNRLNTNIYTRIWIWLASAILLATVFYLRLQSCCTSKPAWLPEVWLLSQISNPLLDSEFWQNIYIQLDQWLRLIQFFIASIALLILFICHYINTHATKQRTNSTHQGEKSNEAN